jgi:hypothetical protein
MWTFGGEKGEENSWSTASFSLSVLSGESVIENEWRPAKQDRRLWSLMGYRQRLFPQCRSRFFRSAGATTSSSVV